MKTLTKVVPEGSIDAQFATQKFTNRPRLIGIAVAVLLAELVWLVATAVVGLQLQAPSTQTTAQPASIGPVAVGVASFIAALLAWGLAAGLERLTRLCRGTWLALTLLGLTASLIMPLSGSGVSVADRLVLVSMHVVVAAVMVPLLYWTWSPHCEAQ
jgi:hypothetical protein